MISFRQSRNISDYRILIDSLIPDFDYVFLYTILQWCKLANDPNENTKQFWEVFLVYHNDEVVGICGLYTLSPHNREEMWLGWLGIIPSFRNKKYGRDIMEFLYKKSKENGCKELLSYVDKGGKPLNFYKREGFDIIGTVSDFLKSSNRNEIDGDEFESPDDYVIKKILIP